ncbi:hypothetical protein MMC25_007377 [Agyrium rufum]|nr:hypothetical protein [Agyrium rufum]
MAPTTEPLLSQDRPPSENSDAQADEEEDALLTGQRKSSSLQNPKRGWYYWREVGIFAYSIVATAVIIILAVLYQHNNARTSDPNNGWDSEKSWTPPSGKKNLIFMVSDGMGPTSLSLTRSFRQFESGLPIDDVLVLDQHLIGSSRTRSTSSLITDSAAGATAFSCGQKSYNGAISVTPEHEACGTVMEAAKKAGYMTGLVVTTRLTDATPACFASHVNVRESEDIIARQMIGDHPLGHVVDLMFGGGRCFFQPNTTRGSCRNDDVDVVQMAKDRGYEYVSDRISFDALDEGNAVNFPILGLFARTDFPYEVDRRFQNDVFPSLDEMAVTALKALSRATADSDKGFFIMIEGSRIDHAGHANDPVAQVHEVLAYDKAFTSVLDFLERDSTPGVVVSTSDHETGGLATARQLHVAYPDYLWYPGQIANASRSSEALSWMIRSYKASKKPSDADMTTYIKEEILSAGLGVHDASSTEIASILSHKGPWPPLHYVLSDIISRRVQSGWSTHGHSAVDVNIYASNPKLAKPLTGNHENTQVGQFLADYLEVDVSAITDEIREKTMGDKEWMGEPLPETRRVEELDHYHGDFRKRCEECGGVEH